MKVTSVHRWYLTNTNDIFFAVKFWIPSLLLQASSKVAVGIFLFHISLLNAVSSWKHFHNNIKHQIFRLFSSSLSGYFKWVWRSFLLGDMSLVDVREPICPGTPYIGRLVVNYLALDTSFIETHKYLKNDPNWALWMCWMQMGFPIHTEANTVSFIAHDDCKIDTQLFLFFCIAVQHLDSNMELVYLWVA